MPFNQALPLVYAKYFEIILEQLCALLSFLSKVLYKPSGTSCFLSETEYIISASSPSAHFAIRNKF